MNQSQSKPTIALDVGEKRIGVAAFDGVVHIARPLGFVAVDGKELEQILRYIVDEKAETLVIGYPRNQSGEVTAQTASVEAFAQRLEQVTAAKLIFQDESLTSVLAEERLRAHGKPYSRGDIDVQAAVLILQDYLEKNS